MSYERIKKVVEVENGEEREGLKAKAIRRRIQCKQPNITLSFSLYIRSRGKDSFFPCESATN